RAEVRFFSIYAYLVVYRPDTKPLQVVPSCTATATCRRFCRSGFRRLADRLAATWLSRSRSEILLQLPNRFHLQKPGMFVRDALVFKRPGAWMRHVYGVQTGSQGRVDIRLRRVSNHPGAFGFKVSFTRQLPVCRFVLLFNNRGMAEVTDQTGAVDLQPLLLRVPFSEQSKLMSRG